MKQEETDETSLVLVNCEGSLETKIRELAAKWNFAVFCEDISGAAEVSAVFLVIVSALSDSMGGLDKVRALKRKMDGQDVMILVLPDESQRQELGEWLKAGGDDFLFHPFSPLELSTRLDVLSSKFHAERRVHRMAEQHEFLIRELRRGITTSLPHEFRTPLAGILSPLEMLMEDVEKLDAESARELLNYIKISADRMHRLIERFLLYLELETLQADPAAIDEIRAQQCPQPLDQLTEIAVLQAMEAAGRETDLGALNLDPGFASLDPEHWTQLVRELIDNSCKFSEAGTAVFVEGRAENDVYVVTISDLGRGLSSSQFANAAAFIQLDRGLYEQQGPGLGLAMAINVARMYQGAIELQESSEAGTSLQIEIPFLGRRLPASNRRLAAV